MYVDEQLKKLDANGRDFPLLRGDVKLTLKNVHNGKTEKYERHNIVTNALADIFDNNYGGLLNYQSFADLYKTFMGGVLLFRDTLDTTTPNDYGIPAQNVNPCVAHAGQTPMTSQRDDITRGDPDDYGTTLLENSTKLTFEWGTSAGNAPQISALGLTHTDVGSFGCGVVSEAQKSLVPFVDVACLSRSFDYGDNANAFLAVHNETAYNFFLVDNTTVHIYKTPINLLRYKLQGGALLPITAYTKPVVVATLPNSYNKGNGDGDCYYHFDFDNNKLILFGVPTVLGDTLYMDTIDLDSGAVTHQTITVTGAKLYKFRVKDGRWLPTVEGTTMSVPTQALILNGNIYVYGCSDSSHRCVADTLFRINLSNTADIEQINTDDMSAFTADTYEGDWTKTTGRHASLGGLLVQNSYIVNGGKCYQTAATQTNRTLNYAYTRPNKISSPVCGANGSANAISICKLYLATKFNLPQPVAKTASQSMTVEYTLTEV